MKDNNEIPKSNSYSPQKPFNPEKGNSGNGVTSHQQLVTTGNPAFDKSVYENLPKVLQELTEKIEDERQRDVFLLASITALASVFPNINIEMGDGIIHPQLYTMVVAPPASGKGRATKAKNLVEPVDKLLKSKAKILNTGSTERGRDDAKDALERKLFIPGNSSARAIYDAIARNEGAGLLFETEIDTLCIAMANEWGDFSDVIRKGFHHEEVSLARKEDQIEVARPRFSIFLTGTDDQVIKFIKDPWNGHFSRYLFYTFEAKPQWISQKPSSSDHELDRLLKLFKSKIFNLYQHLSQRKQPLRFVMSDELWDLHTKRFDQITKELEYQDSPDHIYSYIKRAGVQALRLASIFAMIEYSANIICLDDMDELHARRSHVEAALNIATVSISHARVMANLLDNPAMASMERTPNKKKWYDNLDEKVVTSQAEIEAKNIGATGRTARNWLKDKNLFKKIDHGIYMKKH